MATCGVLRCGQPPSRGLVASLPDGGRLAELAICVQHAQDINNGAEFVYDYESNGVLLGDDVVFDSVATGRVEATLVYLAHGSGNQCSPAIRLKLQLATADETWSVVLTPAAASAVAQVVARRQATAMPLTLSID